MASTPTRAINLSRQFTALAAILPAITGTVRSGRLTCTFPIQPTPASQTYIARLTYQHAHEPQVVIVEPALERHPEAAALPHVYAGDVLCLYYPGQWSHDMLLARTVVPWIAEWLLHYELWLVTGRWTGGGHTYNVPR